MKRALFVSALLGLLFAASATRTQSGAPVTYIPPVIKAALDVGAAGSTIAAYEALLDGISNPQALGRALQNLSGLPEAVKNKMLDAMSKGTNARTFIKSWIETDPQLQKTLAQALTRLSDLGHKGKKLIDLIKGGAQWRTLASYTVTSANALLALKTLGVLMVGYVSYQTAKAVTTEVLEVQDLELKAAESEAYNAVLELLLKNMRTGHVRPLSGLNMEQAMTKVRENLEVGRAPFLNVLEPRPWPNISGAWEGDLVVKEVKGRSSIPEGQRRILKGTAFVITQKDKGAVLGLKLFNNDIKGSFAYSETIPSQIGNKIERMELDTAVLREQPTGALKRAELAIYGLGAGSLQGQLKVEIEQDLPNGVVIVSGGLLKRSGK